MAFEKIVFAMKTWKDKVSGNTPVTAAELNRIEKGISDCAKQTNALGDSVSQIKFLTGSTIVNSFDEKFEGTLFSKERLTGLIGRDYDQACDYIGVSSGDRAGITTYPVSSSYDRTDGSIKVKFTDRNSNAVRVNYLIVLGK